MNILQRVMLKFMPPELRSITDSAIMTALIGGSTTATGRAVSTEGSLQSSAVFACVRVLAESVASLPLILYQRQPNGAKARHIEHGLYPILHDQPNPELTSYELRELLMGHLALWGNAYAEIQRDRAGRIIALWPLRPDRMKVERDQGGQIVYMYRIQEVGAPIPLPFERVMHLRGFSLDGLTGLSPVAVARQSIGLALATEEYGARFFGNGAKPAAVLEYPGQLSDEAAKNIRDSWNAAHQGLSNAHRVAILEEGMSLKSIGIPPNDAQFLETRKFQINEIARIYRVPAHMVGDLERSTNNNIEHQGLEFVTHTLRPWLVRWEQAIGRDLLGEDRGTVFAEHLIDALLRGDIVSRYAAYSQGRQNGWLSANDIRSFENMNPIAGGDQYLVPLNMIPANDVDEVRLLQGQQLLTDTPVEYRIMPSYEIRARDAAPGRQRLAIRFERIILDVSERVMRREINDAKRAITRIFKKRNAEDFLAWMNDFYSEHKDFWIRQILPVIMTYADQISESVGLELDQPPRSVDDIQAFIESFVAALAGRQIAQSLGELTNVMERAADEGAPVDEALIERLDRWDDNRPGQIAKKETFMAANAIAKSFYGLYGVQRIIWVAMGENCPYCSNLDGRTVAINETFLQSGTDFSPEGADRPLPINTDIGHAPAHGGCDCVTMAA